MAEASLQSPLLSSEASDSGERCVEPSVQYLGDRRESKGNITWFVVVLTGFSALGMFLFGYDTGVVSGSMLLIQAEFSMSNVWEEAIVSATIGCAAIFAFIGGPVNEICGRKFSGIFSGIFFSGGAVILGTAQSKLTLLLGRIVIGVGLGISSMTLPMYVSECAPSHVRGRLVQISGLFGTFGFFISNVVDGFFSYDRVNGWRYMLGLAGIPSLVMTLGFAFLPESPRWLVSKRKYHKAKKVLEKIRNSDDVMLELTSIKRACEDSEEKGGFFTLVSIFRQPNTRRALIVGCSLQMFQQLSGINTIMYYTATVVKSAGITDDHKAIWLSAAVAAINVIFSILGIFLIDRIGRRKLIFASYLGVIGSLIWMAVGFQLIVGHSPHITVHEAVGPCDRFRICEGCIRSGDCGFCFEGRGSNGSCVALDESLASYSAVGRCSRANITTGHATWARTYCPTDQYWIPLVGICLYIVSFAPGLAGIPWLMNAEIYPPWARSTGNALSTATNWFFNVIVAMTFLSLAEVLTKFGIYWLYTGLSIVGLIFLAYVLPETKGKSLEEMELLFERPWC